MPDASCVMKALGDYRAHQGGMSFSLPAAMLILWQFLRRRPADDDLLIISKEPGGTRLYDVTTASIERSVGLAARLEHFQQPRSGFASDNAKNYTDRLFPGWLRKNRKCLEQRFRK